MGKRVAYSAMLIALSLIFSYIEILIPINLGIPGIKLGLANLIVLCGLYFLSASQVFIICIVRIILAGFLFGNMTSIIYSLIGGIFSFIAMFILIHIKAFSEIGISIAGGIFHNIGQLTVAWLILKSKALVYYFPILLSNEKK